jgi:hypothetical protein
MCLIHSRFVKKIPLQRAGYFSSLSTISEKEIVRGEQFLTTAPPTARSPAPHREVTGAPSRGRLAGEHPREPGSSKARSPASTRARRSQPRGNRGRPPREQARAPGAAHHASRPGRRVEGPAHHASRPGRCVFLCLR